MSWSYSQWQCTLDQEVGNWFKMSATLISTIFSVFYGYSWKEHSTHVSSYSQWQRTLDQEEGNLFKKSAISTIFNLGKDSELGEEFLDHFILILYILPISSIFWKKNQTFGTKWTMAYGQKSLSLSISRQTNQPTTHAKQACFSCCSQKRYFISVKGKTLEGD